METSDFKHYQLAHNMSFIYNKSDTTYIKDKDGGRHLLLNRANAYGIWSRSKHILSVRTRVLYV